MFSSLFLWGSFALAKPDMPSLDTLVRESIDIDAKYDTFEQNFSSRKGILGAIAAEGIFEQAMNAFMLKQYVSSTLLFYTLVQDNALAYDDFKRYQGRWLLIESSYNAGNFLIAEEFCKKVLTEPEDPFLIEAVRRLLEIYGLEKRDIEFKEIVDTYVKSGLLQSTDKMRYTIGKSLYWQDKVEESIAELETISEESILYAQRTYFMGGIFASQGEAQKKGSEKSLEYYSKAIEYFQTVEKTLEPKIISDKVFVDSQSAGTRTEAEQEVYELSLLGQGRVLLEIDQYEQSIAAYSKLPSTSKYYPDVLYELIWTYVKREAWEDASRLIDIFLIGFPEHEYAIRLELIRGQIKMNAGDNEAAVNIFTSTRERLEEVLSILSRLTDNEQAALQLFYAMRDKGDLQAFSTNKPFQPVLEISKLPHYAKEMLRIEPGLKTALKLSKEMLTYHTELKDMERDLKALKEHLERGYPLGAIQKEQMALAQFRQDVVLLVYKTLNQEFNLLEDNLVGSSKRSLIEAKKQWKLESKVFENLLSNKKAGGAFVEAHLAQVRAVQELGNELMSEVKRLDQELSSLMGNINASDFSESQAQVVRDLHKALQEDLKEQYDRLVEVTSEQKKILIMANVDTNIDGDGYYAKLLKKLQETHEKKVKPYWKQVQGQKSSRTKIDDIFARVEPYFATLDSFEEGLASMEEERRSMLMTLIEKETDVVSGIIEEHQTLQASVDKVSLQAAREGFRNIEAKVSQNILNADLGLVKIEWSRYIAKENLQKRLQKEKKTKEDINKRRFDIIQDKLPEPIVKTSKE